MIMPPPKYQVRVVRKGRTYKDLEVTILDDSVTEEDVRQHVENTSHYGYSNLSVNMANRTFFFTRYTD